MNIKNIVAVVLTVSLWLVASAAHAQTPGNTSLVNKATLTYAGNTDGIFAEVTVTVEVVGSPATLLDLGDIFRSENQSLAREYTITATNNGPDTYTIGATGAGDANTENNTALFTFNSKVDGTGDVLTNNVVLGASALAVDATVGALTIVIPSDGDATGGVLGAGSVNGLETGDTVVIGADTYVLGTVTDTGTGNITIALTQVGTATGLTGAVVAGVSVFEVKSVFILNADVGDRVDPLVTAVVTVTTTLDGVLSTPTTPDTFLITIVRVTINKYVRNVTASGGCTGTCTAVTSSGVDYFAAGTPDAVVKANSGDTLQYLVRVNVPNEDGANLTVANIADILPPFTEYVGASTLLNDVTVASDPVGTPGTFPLAGAGLPIDDDLARTAGAVASGNVAKNAEVDIVYQVKLL
ncbi:MAG: hypothetical protein ACI9TP_000759 [Candidatus Azotimanducaceae bacterium]|jgi:hypothetical protein